MIQMEEQVDQVVEEELVEVEEVRELSVVLEDTETLRKRRACRGTVRGARLHAGRFCDVASRRLIGTTVVIKDFRFDSQRRRHADRAAQRVGR